MSEWDIYETRVSARWLYVTAIMSHSRAVLILAARGLADEPWVGGRRRVGPTNPTVVWCAGGREGKGLTFHSSVGLQVGDMIG